jgi:hypothetical protein
MQPVRVFPYKQFNQQGCFSAKYSMSKDSAVQNSQSAGIFENFRHGVKPPGIFSEESPVSDEVLVREVQSARTFYS